MLESIVQFFRSEDDQDPSFIQLTRNILIFVMIVNFATLPLVTGIVGGVQARNILALIILSLAFVVECIALYFVLQGNVLLAKITVPTVLVLAIGTIAFNANGIKDTSFFALPAVLVVSAILLGKRSLIVITPLVIVAIIITAIRDLTTGRQPRPVGLDDAIIIPLLMIASSGITHLLITRLNESTIRAQQSEQVQKRENEELVALRSSLEDRVRERTLALEKANQINEKRARQFSAVAQVMSAVSSIESLDSLLPRITQVISEQFNVYHAGIFLLDAKRENAVLRAANSPGGQRMLARKHALKVGQTGLVGFVTATGQARIALDVGADSVYFDNPDLPDTHSEITLPLHYGGQVIGALDVQSLETNAFGQDDIDVLSTLADQVAVAINNSLTIEEAQKTLEEAQSAIGKTTQEAWQILRPKSLGIGFELAGEVVKPLEEPLQEAYIHEAMQTGKMVAADQNTRIAIPIRLREQVVGVMQLNSRGGRTLSSDDAEIAEAVAERLALAIETATLLQSTQHRADLERVTANITSRVSSFTRFDSILQTAARELSRALGGSDVLVQIEPAALKMQS